MPLSLTQIHRERGKGEGSFSCTRELIYFCSSSSHKHVFSIKKEPFSGRKLSNAINPITSETTTTKAKQHQRVAVAAKLTKTRGSRSVGKVSLINKTVSTLKLKTFCCRLFHCRTVPHRQLCAVVHTFLSLVPINAYPIDWF